MDTNPEYDKRRQEILRRIEAGEISASMSGIEYYPKPWAELDPTKPIDALVLQLWNAPATR